MSVMSGCNPTNTKKCQGVKPPWGKEGKESKEDKKGKEGIGVRGMGSG